MALVLSGCEPGYSRAVYLRPPSDAVVQKANASADATAPKFGFSVVQPEATQRNYTGHDDEGIDPDVPGGARTIGLVIQRPGRDGPIYVNLVQPFISRETRQFHAVWTDLICRLVDELGADGITPRHGESYGESRSNGRLVR